MVTTTLTKPSRAIAHPIRRRSAPTTRKPTTRKPKDKSPLAVLRREAAAADREKHESAYFLHVVLPLAMEGYPRPKSQALLIPERKYRIDFAYLEERLAVEIQGQIWHKGGHTSGRGLTRDAEKYNALACIGWKLLIITPEMIDSGEALEWTRRALHAADMCGAS